MDSVSCTDALPVDFSLCLRYVSDIDLRIFDKPGVYLITLILLLRLHKLFSFAQL